MTDLFETSLVAALAVEPDGRIARASRGCLEILGWPPAELVGLRLSALARPEHAGRVDKALAYVARGAPSAIVRARFAHEGRELELMIRLEPVPEGLYAIAEDVGVRAAILPKGSQLQSLVDYTADAWFVHDLDGRIRDVNPWAHKSLGYTREEMLALRVSDFEATIEPGRMDGVWNRMEIGKPVTVEGLQVRKDGSRFPVEVRLGLFSTEEDEILMLAVARDTTERKAQEAKPRELAERLQQLNEHLEDEVATRTRELSVVIESLADGLFAEDAAGMVRASNRTLETQLGLPASPTGRRVADALPPTLAQLSRECIEQGTLRTVEIELTRGRIGLAVASPVRDSDSPLGAVTLVRDVTLEKEIDEMKTNFIAMVSHELRTPLTSVLGFAKLTKNKLEKAVFPALPADDTSAQRAVERVRGNVDIIVAEGERLTHLIDDVLDIAKMEAGRMDWAMAPLDPQALLARAVATCGSLFPEDGPVRFEQRIEGPLPTIVADEDRLMQVLINLVSNAVKFTEEGAVRLVARAKDGALEVAVEDTGDGIDPALHDSIFEKFKQVGDTLTGKPKGTGLGLPISRQIVEAHGGRLWVESRLGEGARFVFALPAAPATAVPAFRAPNVDQLVQRIERAALSQRAPGRDILVVDDDPSLRELLRQQLTDRGFAVRLATDGYEAIEAARSRRPDLVILDVMMPGLSGFDVAAMLKNDPKTESVPILVLSILADEQRGLRLGIDRYMQKPMEADGLVEAVEELVAGGDSPRRVLVVDRDQTAASDIGRLLGMKGYEVVAVCTGEDAIAQAREHRPDLILVESLVEGHAELVRAIRFERDLDHVLVIQLMDEG